MVVLSNIFVRLSTLPVPQAHTKGSGASTAMPVVSKLSASSAIPPEIWSNVFHIATFIPDEWDEVVSKDDMRIFAASYPQMETYHSILPLRRTIVEVCRLWYKIGTKLLYASFHYTRPKSEEPSRRLAAFAHVLVARPHLGRLVKRLSVWWSPTVTDNELIIRHCPNTIIFSSYQADSSTLCSPWVRSLPESLRCLEANVNTVETAEIMRILYAAPNLESLYLWQLAEAGSTSQYPHLGFPALRQLCLYFSDPKVIKSWLPILSSIDAPKLIAFTTNLGSLGSAVSSFPRDIWERIAYLGVSAKGYRYIRSTHLLSLQYLNLDLEEGQVLTKLQINFPFHQLESLTLCLIHIHLVDVREWRPYIRKLLEFPLDTKMMPSLRILELEWMDGGIEASVARRASHKDVLSKFLISLGSLAVQAEKRDVCFLEHRESMIFHTRTLIQDVVAACKKQVL